nr:metallophosphoesterase family protein [uncultured Anaerosporobacter sp.]
MTTISILSDTHGLLREEVKQQLKNSDIIIHAGDINTQGIVYELRSFAPLYIVRGNNDKEWASELPTSLLITIEEVRIFIVHNKKDIPKDLSDVDLIVHGHSHKYDDKEVDGVRMFNPGSCGKRRFDLEITMANMIVDGSSFHIEKITI